MLSWVFNQPTIGGSMTHKNVWFITGAGRGMGVHIARAALAAGNAVVATGRNTDTVTKAVGEADDLLVVKLDVTRPEDAQAAVKAAVARFGHIDVLANNAGNFYAGFFEEITPQDFRAQVETLLFGPLNVTRAVLPVMRAQRSGLVVTISSTAGIRGGEFLTPESTHYAEPTSEDYAEKTGQTVTAWSSMNGLQGGDPAKLAKALVQLASQDEPPLRWAAGADAVEDLEQKAQRLLAQADAYRELSSSLAHDDTNA